MHIAPIGVQVNAITISSMVKHIIIINISWMKIIIKIHASSWGGQKNEWHIKNIPPCDMINIIIIKGATQHVSTY